MDAGSEGSFVGIDVSKDRLDGFVRPEGRKFSVANTEEGIEKLLREFTGIPLALIVVEATGGLEIALVSALASAGLPVVMINPRQARAYAKAIGKLAKTDGIDAEVLARFGEATRPELRPFKDQEAQQITALLARRRQMVEMLTQEKNRKARASQAILASISEHIAWLEKRIQEIEKQLTRIVRDSPAWRDKDDLLRSVPGVGKVLSFALLADLPELGTLNQRKISTLVGVAPLNRDSGNFKGTRAIWGGRAKVRHVLYMATVAAIRHNPIIQGFHQRLRQSGKKPKVAIVACMHKLLIILNTMVKNGTRWQVHERPAT